MDGVSVIVTEPSLPQESHWMSSGHLQQDQVSVYYCSHSNTHSSHTSISESISKFKAFQKAMLRTMITISGLLFLLKTNVNAHCLCLYLSVWHVFFFCLYMPPPIWDSCKFCVFLGFSPLGKIFSFLLPSTSLHLKTKINS